MNVLRKQARHRGLVYALCAVNASCLGIGGCADPRLPEHGEFGDGGAEGEPHSSGGSDETGGTRFSTGGRTGSGGRQEGGQGAAASGGTAGPTMGGSFASSGGKETGGRDANGGTHGTTGGVSSTGGTNAMGGVSSTGGNSSHTGGVAPTGGMSPVGGNPSYSGGANSTGGVPSMGGAVSTGGSGSGGSGANLLKSSGFETTSLDGWRSRGTATLAVSDEQYHSGYRSLKVTGRTAGWHGAEYDVMNLLTPGEPYDVSVWVRPTPGSAVSTLMLTRELHGCGATDYTWVASASNASGTSWVELRGTLTISASCTPTKLVIYVESSNATLSYYLDDTSLRAH